MVDEKRACLFDRKYDYRKETNVEYRSCISPKTQRLNHLFTFKEMTFGRELKKKPRKGRNATSSLQGPSHHVIFKTMSSRTKSSRYL